jgi:metallo-beta-lactamase family protein
MFEGGKIGIYLKRYLEDYLNTLLIVSFQVDGSLGRRIIEGQKIIEVENKTIEIKANISTIFSFSSHGDCQMLSDWVKRINPKKIFVVHGEESASVSLAMTINGEVPFYDVFYSF